MRVAAAGEWGTHAAGGIPWVTRTLRKAVYLNQIGVLSGLMPRLRVMSSWALRALSCVDRLAYASLQAGHGGERRHPRGAGVARTSRP